MAVRARMRELGGVTVFDMATTPAAAARVARAAEQPALVCAAQPPAYLSTLHLGDAPVVLPHPAAVSRMNRTLSRRLERRAGCPSGGAAPRYTPAGPCWPRKTVSHAGTVAETSRRSRAGKSVEELAEIESRAAGHVSGLRELDREIRAAAFCCPPLQRVFRSPSTARTHAAGWETHRAI